MKKDKPRIAVLLLCITVSGCASINYNEPGIMSGIRDQRILNLRNCRLQDPGNPMNEATVDRVMKSGFLNTQTPEYGYYFMRVWVEIEYGGYLLIVPMALTGSLPWVLLGLPWCIGTYYAHTELYLFDSHGALVKEYTKTTFIIKKTEGAYNSLFSAQVAREGFSRAVTELQALPNSQSDEINQRLLAAGPITPEKDAAAVDAIYTYLRLTRKYPPISLLPKAPPPQEPVPVTKTYLDALDKAIQISYDIISENLPKNSTIVVINISSANAEDERYIIEKLSTLLVNSPNKYQVLDRESLDAVKKEQDFQMTGAVDDRSAAKIGGFVAATMVITGSITGEGERRNLVIRAIEVETAKVIARSMERF